MPRRRRTPAEWLMDWMEEHDKMEQQAKALVAEAEASGWSAEQLHTLRLMNSLRLEQSVRDVKRDRLLIGFVYATLLVAMALSGGMPS